MGWCRAISAVVWYVSIIQNENNPSNPNLTKERDCMKGIKIGIVGVCVSLLGIAIAMNNFIAICGATIGLLLAFMGCLAKDKGA